MRDMMRGKFLGIENDMVKIAYQGYDENGPKTMIFSYPYMNRDFPHKDTMFHFGRRTVNWSTEDILPEIGQEVLFDSPGPDMAGHLMVDVYPVEVA